ncbi:MAG TPA: hypothetical protein VGM62_08155 [Chthoniobacterales bacterium]|jgi:hypothetical protein
MKLLLVALFAVVGAISGAESSGYDVTPADKAFMAEVLAAVQRKDAAWIASHTLLPIAVGSGEKHRIVKSEKEFRAIVDRSLSADLTHRMKMESKHPLFKNWRGVMMGDGILWFTEYRVSDAQRERYVILAFGDFAFQP